LFANPIGLFALLAVPAIVALHLFRRRFRPHPVSALFLWGDEDRTPLAGRQREKLRKTGSLFAECLAALCLALALAGPRACDARAGEHLVVVLDGSASMSARPQSGRSAAERAVEELRARIEALDGSSRVTLIESGMRARMLAGPGAFPKEALAALDTYAPRAPHHDLTPATALALQLAGGGSVACFTDGYEPDAFPPEVELQAFGAPQDNVGIVQARRVRERGDSGAIVERLSLVLASFAHETRRTELTGFTEDGTNVFAPLAVELAPGERRTLSVALPAATPLVEARIGSDALAIDDHAYIAPRAPRTLRLGCDWNDELVRELGLGANAQQAAERWSTLIEDARPVSTRAEAHAWLASAAADSGSAWSLVIERGGTERQDFISPFLTEKRHPLLEGTTFEGIVWSADPAFGQDGVPLVSAGNLPLLIEQRDDARRTFVLNLDPARSSLARSPDWPIVLANFAEERRNELPGPEQVNLRAGEVFVYRADVEADGAPFQLTGPDTRVELAARPRIESPELASPGVYRLQRGGADACTFGVSFFDARESDLTHLGSGHRPARGARAAIPGDESRLATWLVAAALVFFALDWCVLARGFRGSAGAAVTPLGT
jgi:hypothetical protein